MENINFSKPIVQKANLSQPLLQIFTPSLLQAIGLNKRCRPSGNSPQYSEIWNKSVST